MRSFLKVASFALVFLACAHRADDLVAMSPVFAPRSGGEHRSSTVADALIEEWGLISATGAITARHTEPFAENLNDVRSACGRLVERIKQQQPH